MEILEFLPEKGVCGTLYLYLFPQAPPVEKERWHVMSWDGKQFHANGCEETLEALRSYADTLLWAEGWLRVQCTAPERQINPCIRVEFEYKDGRIQRLTGLAAEAWLKNVNDVCAATAIRYGESPIIDHPWEFSRKKSD